MPPKTKNEHIPVTSIEIYHTKAQVTKLLKQKGELLIEKLSDCWDISLSYLRTIGDVILFLVDDEIASLACMSLMKDKRYYLSTVCTFLKYRGKGYCTPFIKSIIESKRYSEFTTYLEVNKTNEAAIKCYIKAGFIYKEEYDKQYDVYEYNGDEVETQTLNLLVYAMACNDPGLASATAAVSLELGVMADIGKLTTSALSSKSDNWLETIYVDIYPTNYTIELRKKDGKVTVIPGRLGFLVLDSCCLGNIENVYTFRNLTDYIVCYQAEGPWNGFISTDTLSFCSDISIKECLKKSLEKYKEQSESQENPSPVTLISTLKVDDLYTAINKLPKTKDHYFRDILSYASTVLNKTEYKKFLELYNKVVIAYEVPDNYESEDGEQNGLGAYI